MLGSKCIPSIIIGFPSFIAFFRSPAKPLRTTLHSLQNSVINSSEELKSRSHTGVDANGASVDVRSNSYTISVCNTLGKFSLCASWVAIVDFPTQAVPPTRITNGTL
uniref:Uncharacterized protein MANES_06G133800 n=1 Tax=Rhizophora mucronata TaxID=61149 RepID=A0A2P2JQA5_RHIMU